MFREGASGNFWRPTKNKIQASGQTINTPEWVFNGGEESISPEQKGSGGLDSLHLCLLAKQLGFPNCSLVLGNTNPKTPGPKALYKGIYGIQEKVHIPFIILRTNPILGAMLEPILTNIGYF